MDAKVSVVVAVYNPGEFIRPCIDSLLGQSLPPGALELIFVDDGSTDETPALLDRLCDEHPHVQVVHQENSGWPGKPRNVGMQVAGGEYVMFMDQDDAMGLEALGRMYDFGARNGADIVIGKVTSNFRGVPHAVWRTNIEKCTIRDHDLINSLTPHKMFRRQFLLDNGIRYAEGKRRLEDQLFMITSYLAAQCVSVLGDYPCYFYLKRADGGHAGAMRIDPRSYYSNVREVLDVVETRVEAGAFRDSLLRRFYRSEMLRKLTDGLLLGADTEHRTGMFNEIRRLALERFPDTVAASLPSQFRVRAALVRQGRLEDLIAFAGRVKQVRGTAAIQNVHWRDGVLHADVTAGLVLADGSPVRLRRPDGHYVLDPRIVAGLVPDDLADATDDDESVTVELLLRHKPSAVEWSVPAHQAPDGIQARAHVAIDPCTIAGGSALDPGAWVLLARVRGCGLVRGAALVPVDVSATAATAPSALLGSPAMTVAPRFSEVRPHVVLDVDEGRLPFGKDMSRALRQQLSVDRAGVLTAVLPAVTRAGTSALPIVVELRADTDSAAVAVIDGWMQPEGTDVLVRAQLPPLSSVTLPRDTTRLLVLWRLASSQRPPTKLGHVRWSRNRFTGGRNMADRITGLRVYRTLPQRLRRRLSSLAKD